MGNDPTAGVRGDGASVYGNAARQTEYLEDRRKIMDGALAANVTSVVKSW